MARYLLVSGSPRDGNTEYVMRRLHAALGGASELVLLRKLKIGRCTGCLACEGTGKCPIEDDMQGLYRKMEKAAVLVIATPNYFDNVSGLLKDFIDRCNAFYNSGRIKGKKAVFIVVGGGSAGDSRRVVGQALRYFANGVGLDVAGSFIFTGTDRAGVRNTAGAREKIEAIAMKIRSLIKNDAPAGI